MPFLTVAFLVLFSASLWAGFLIRRLGTRRGVGPISLLSSQPLLYRQEVEGARFRIPTLQTRCIPFYCFPERKRSMKSSSIVGEVVAVAPSMIQRTEPMSLVSPIPITKPLNGYDQFSDFVAQYPETGTVPNNLSAVLLVGLWIGLLIRVLYGGLLDADANSRFDIDQDSHPSPFSSELADNRGRAIPAFGIAFAGIDFRSSQPMLLPHVVVPPRRCLGRLSMHFSLQESTRKAPVRFRSDRLDEKDSRPRSSGDRAPLS